MPPSNPRALRVAARAHPAELRWRRLPRAAAAGKDLAGVEEAVGIEGGAQTFHGLEVVEREQLAHHRALLDSHAVLARDRSAHADAHAQDLVRGVERRGLRLGVVGI